MKNYAEICGIMSTIALSPDFSRTSNYGVGRNHNSPCWTTVAAMMNNSAIKGKEERFGKSAKQSINVNRGLPKMKKFSPFTLSTILKYGGDTSEDEDMVPFEAVHNEEFWAVAQLRAECLWENRENQRNSETRKWLFAQQEFTSLKKRCDGLLKRCKCFLMLKKEDGSGYANRIAGTLDLNVRFVSLRDQTFLPDPKKREERRLVTSPGDKYGFISNLCVAKTARRQGVATALLHHAISSARDLGLERVFIRVDEDNEAAITLYEKIGFKIVIDANPAEKLSISGQPLGPLPLLLCFDVAKNLLE